MDLPVSSEARKKYIIVFIVGLAMVVLVAAGVFWFFNYSKKSPAEEKMPSWAKDLKGIVRLTLADKKDGNTSMSGGLYVLDLGTKERQPILNLKDGRLNITEYVSPDGRLGVYASFPSAADQKSGQNRSQLFTRNLINGERKQITNSQTSLKRNPEWSPDGKLIAFMAQSAVSASTTKAAEYDLKKWSVFVTDLQGQEQLISEGVYPQWLPDSQRLIVSREDGLYFCWLADAKCERVLELPNNGKASLGIKIDLARDGKTIAYSNPGAEEVILIKVSSLDPLRLEAYRGIKLAAFWPVFSEDSKYLIVEEIDWGVPNDKMMPRLVAYNLETMEKVTLLSLDDFWQDKMFITDWRY